MPYPIKPVFPLTILLSLLFFLISAPQLAHSSTVNGLKHWSNPSYTRVVISLDRSAGFTHRLLKKDPSINKPRRLYIDIKGATLARGLDKTVHINDGLLKAARTGQHDRSTVRVVLDIESIEDYKIFPLSDPFRIVVDVSGEKSGGGGGGSGGADGTIGAIIEGREGEAPSKDASKAPDSREAGGTVDGTASPGSQTGSPAPRPFRKIVIDAGHGGNDPGAIGRGGLREKDITLKVSRMLKDTLRSRTGAKIIMTRETDIFIPLEERTAIANKHDADLFVSIHVNASPRRAASGVETYVLNVSYDEEARRVAARENATSRKAVGDLEFILADLMKSAKMNDSARLASSVHERLVGSLRTSYPGIRSNGVKGAPFYVLVGTRMPSILVEVSFISNSTEERRMRDERYLRRLVEGIAAGLINYINGAGTV